MPETTPLNPTPTWMKWTGWVLSVLPMPMLAMSAFFKILNRTGS